MKESISSLLKKIREKKNISLAELSEKTGVSKSALQRYEVGSTKKIPAEALSKIENALGLKNGYFSFFCNLDFTDKDDKEFLEEYYNNLIISDTEIPEDISLLKDLLKQCGYSLTYRNDECFIAGEYGGLTVNTDEIKKIYTNILEDLKRYMREAWIENSDFLSLDVDGYPVIKINLKNAHISSETKEILTNLAKQNKVDKD